MQKINRTTNDRTLDEDLRRLYKQRDLLDARLSALESTSTASTSPSTSPVAPLPSISGGTTVSAVAVSPVVGVSTSYAHEDHVHNGCKQVYMDASVPAGNTIGNTTTETAFASVYTIPANVLVVGMSIRLTMYLTINLIAGAQMNQFRVKLGSQTILDSGLISLTGPMTNGGIAIAGDLFVTATGATGSVEAQGVSQLGAPTSGSSINLPNSAPFVVDTTVTESLTLTWQFGTANAGNNVTLRAMRVEILQ